MRILAVTALLASALAAGCMDDERTGHGAILGEAVPAGALPTMSKASFQATQPPSGTLPLPNVPGMPPSDAEPVGTLQVQAGMGRLHIALDYAGSGEPLDVRLEGPDGVTIHEERVMSAGKTVRDLEQVLAGDHKVYATSASPWTVAVVATLFPADSKEGVRLQVSSPEQTEIEHTFVPTRISTRAAEPFRITLYDYDPHAGTANRQHNLHFPTLGLRTEGKTTWGEVRVIDMPPIALGTYPFECEFHGFTGELVVN